MATSGLRQKLYAEIAQAIRGEIENGVLRPGDRLPALSELAEKYRCSRATVREALGALRGQGLVEFRHGNGTFIRTATVEMWMEPIDAAILLGASQMRDLIQMQTAVLSGIATIVAGQRATSDYSPLSHALFELECAAGDLDVAIAAELTFYLTMAELSGNIVLENALRILQESLRSTLRLANPKQGLGIKCCCAVYDAIQCEDEQRARDAIFDYGHLLEQLLQQKRNPRLPTQSI